MKNGKFVFPNSARSAALHPAMVRSAADAEDIVQEAFVNSGYVITSPRLISFTAIVGALAAKPKFLPMPSNRSNRSFATDLPQPALLT